MAGSDPSPAVELRHIHPDTPEYDEARELRYQCLYAHLGLPYELIEDTDGRTYQHLAAFEPDGRIVGYARIHLQEDDCRVFQVCVASHRRRQGIATTLMRELMRLATELGRTEMTLDARVHAIPLYEGLGFVAEGEEFLSERTGTPHRAMRCVLGGTL